MITYLSMLATIVCFAGMILNVKKKKACFVVWLIGNTVWLLIDINSMAVSRIILDIAQQIFNAWGLIEWRKKEK